MVSNKNAAKVNGLGDNWTIRPYLTIKWPLNSEMHLSQSVPIYNAPILQLATVCLSVIRHEFALLCPEILFLCYCCLRKKESSSPSWRGYESIKLGPWKVKVYQASPDYSQRSWNFSSERRTSKRHQFIPNCSCAAWRGQECFRLDLARRIPQLPMQRTIVVLMPRVFSIIGLRIIDFGKPVLVPK